MNESRREEYLLYSGLGEFHRKLEQARTIIRRWLDVCECPYVSFSGGKCSTAMLEMAREQAPDAVAVFSNDEWNYPETLELVDATENVARIASTVVHDGWDHDGWFVTWPDGPIGLPEDTTWVDATTGEGIQTYARQKGYDGAGIGLRREESRGRRDHIDCYGTMFWGKKDQVWRCYPLAHWKTRDVWALIVSRDLHYNRAYDRLTAMGVPLEHQRIGPFNRGIPLLKRGWPDLWGRFAARYPEARRYT